MPITFTRYFLLFFFASLLAAQAQQGGSIHGHLVDIDNKPLPFGNLLLRHLPDSGFTKMGISKEDGSFSFVGLAPGKYFIEAGMVGYRKLKTQPMDVAASVQSEAGNLVMKPVDVQLKEVYIEQQKPFLIVEPDKLVVKVDNNPLMINTNALDVLKKSPGVMVNQDDQIFLMGKSGLLVYIDGRQSPLSEKDLSNWLRSIPSSQIESIEIITNPSARYDAAGNAGIINIRLKKSQKMGLNGTVNSGVSNGLASEYNYLKTNHSISLNRGWKKVNLFANYGYDYSKNWNFMDIYRVQSDQVYNQETDNFEKNQSHNFKLGADWKLGPRHIVSGMVDGNFSDNHTDGTSINYISNIGSAPYRLLQATNSSDRTNGTANFNLNHQYKDTLGREVFTDANYGLYQIDTRTNQPNFYRGLGGDTSVTDRSFGLQTPVKISIATLKTDFEQKMKKSTLGAGYKVSNVLTDNDFNYFDRANGGNAKDLTQSSNFTYLERVIAGYVTFRHKLNTKLSLQAGVRIENTHSEGHLTTELAGGDSLVKRNYTNLFPSAGVTYSPSQKHSITLSYSRRIDRPVYRFLNPFQYKLDELSYEQGNPFLNPQYTDNYQVTHNMFSMITTTVGYSHTTNFFARVIDSSGTRSYLTRRNLADVNTFSVNISSPLPIRKWWNGFFNFTYNYRVFEADFGAGKQLNLPINFYMVYMQHSFSLPHQFTFQVSGYYNSPNVWGGTFKNRRFWSMEAGVTKKVLKGKGVISLNVNDIFLSQRWQGESNFGGIRINVKGGSDSRQIRLGFSYNFGKQENKAPAKKSGNQEERQRLRGE